MLRNEINRMKEQQVPPNPEEVTPILEEESLFFRPRSISTFAELSRSFPTHFIFDKKSRKPSTHLLTLKQRSGESLKDYISLFNEEALQVDDYLDKMTLSMMISGLNEGKRRLDDAPQHADKRKSDNNTTRDRRPSRKPERKFHSYTPLNTSLEQILLDIRDQRLLHWLSYMKTDAGQRDKSLKHQLIKESHYPKWIANVVLVKKANGKWQVCIDYSDLNKACPKDSFPLHQIDQLVDSTTGHERLTFLDAYSGYNQIRMYPPNRQKTTFVTDKGLYCYRVMLFDMKNTGETYQRLVN
ncbi:uncharacterized protein LOC131238977 [Magnolia sinica]|uniref:uncharacterized protein LOC131238977 n=1 Tax=Magnolia sinica TaxID=86752 RepID=UPI00265ABB0C|nr:uncharacterized protein LOC131238977 [Magnolia sinica]